MVMTGSKQIKRLSFDGETGSLLVEIYGPGRKVYRLDSWEAGLRLHGDTGSGPVNLVLFLSKLRLGETDVQALDAFASSIPEEVVRLALSFPHAQLQMLQLLRGGGESALELARDIPVLVWLLASAVLGKGVGLSAAISLTRGKRLEIVRAVYPEGATGHLKLIKRMWAPEYTAEVLRAAYWVLRNETAQRHLRHCSLVVLPLLAEIANAPDLLAFPVILREVSDELGSRYRLKAARAMCETCLRLGEEGGVSNVGHILRNCKSLEEVTSLSNRWHLRYNRKLIEETATLNREKEAVADFGQVMRAEMRRRAQLQRERVAAMAIRRRERAKNTRAAMQFGFPIPPIPGNEYIVPITTYAKLVREGETMHNCVATYVNKVANGDSYIYQVFYPQRCTLEILLDSGCSVGEMKAPANKAPSKAAKAYVKKWLRLNGYPQ